MPRTIKRRNIPCPDKGCTQTFSNRAGLSNHLRTQRVPNQRKENPSQASPSPEPLNDVDPVQPDLPDLRRREIIEFHPFLNGASVNVDIIFRSPSDKAHRSSMRFQRKFSARRSTTIFLGLSPS
jgi:hypothetical protein